MRKKKDINFPEARSTQQPLLQFLSNTRQVFHESLIGDADVDLLRNIEISIQVKVDLSLLGEVEVQVTGNDEYSDHIEDNEGCDLGLQSKGSFLDPPTDKGSDALDDKG